MHSIAMDHFYPQNNDDKTNAMISKNEDGVDFFMKTSISNTSLSSYFRVPTLPEKKGILKGSKGSKASSQDPDVVPSQTGNKRKTRTRPFVSCFVFMLLIISFLVLLMVGIDQLGFPTLIEACYKFPEGVKDPCVELDCKFGSDCIRSRDGKKAECICPEKCYTYGDNVGSRPVCGSDGRDYPNDCEMRRRSCSLNISVEAKFTGKCDPCDSIDCPINQVCQLDDNRSPVCRCNAVCNQEFKPVCSSDGKL